MKPERENSINSKHRRGISLRWRIFYYMLLFTLLLVGLLWLFQIVYLDRFYEKIQTDRISQMGELLASSLDESEDYAELSALALDTAQRLNMCVIVMRVYNRDMLSLGHDELASVDVNADCIIHHIDWSSYIRFYEQTQSAGGIYHERFARNQFMAAPADNNFWEQLVSLREVRMPDSLVFARISENAAGDTFFIVLNSTISPLSATVETLRIQLLIISVIMTVLALILSDIIARRLSRPIAAINESAQRLAAGDFSGHFEGHGYREISQLAATLNYAAAELKRTGSLQQELIANISHDLRTPLTMIGGYAEFMRDFPEEEHQESLNVITSETERLARLINDVLDLSRLNAGVEEMRPTPYYFTAQLSMLVNRYQVLMEPNGYKIELVQHLSEGESLIRADEQRMEQVVGNLLNNALAHAGADKLITVRVLKAGKKLRVEVSDHGPGIAPEELPNIWQRYYRTDAPARAAQGSGLGLSIVRSILEKHRAEYGVQSAEGVGSTFWFELPGGAPGSPHS